MKQALNPSRLPHARCDFLFAVAVIVLLLFPTSYGKAGESSVPRIISLYAAHTEVLLRLGARDAIIGVSRQESYQGPETENWLPETYSFQDDVEKFIAASPDLVLVRPQHLAGGKHMAEALERAGIRVWAKQVVHASDLYGYWRELAALVGKEVAAEHMIAGFDRDVARYRVASEKRVAKPGVFLEAIHREVKTFTPDSIPGRLVELAGGRNIAADALPTTPGVVIAEYGPERLLAKADEIDIFISQQGAMNRTPLEVITDRDIYQPLAAFKSGRVFKISESVLARPTPSLAEGLKKMAEWTGLRVE